MRGYGLSDGSHNYKSSPSIRHGIERKIQKSIANGRTPGKSIINPNS